MCQFNQVILRTENEVGKDIKKLKYNEAKKMVYVNSYKMELKFVFSGIYL